MKDDNFGWAIAWLSLLVILQIYMHINKRKDIKSFEKEGNATKEHSQKQYRDHKKVSASDIFEDNQILDNKN